MLTESIVISNSKKASAPGESRKFCGVEGTSTVTLGTRTRYLRMTYASINEKMSLYWKGCLCIRRGVRSSSARFAPRWWWDTRRHQTPAAQGNPLQECSKNEMKWLSEKKEEEISVVVYQYLIDGVRSQCGEEVRAIEAHNVDPGSECVRCSLKIYNRRRRCIQKNLSENKDR